MLGELIEKLCVANIKLYHICNTKADIASNPANYSKEQMVANAAADIELCKQRGAIKKAIDKSINDAIITGETSIIDEVKQYGR